MNELSLAKSQIDSRPVRWPSFSIIINTLNRGASLDATLRSFCWLRYDGDFEVIVVNGPSTDDSDAVIARWGNEIRAARCPVANLSVSRNIGIAMASGELIAFIDDDAIPEPEWLEQLAASYENPEVGAVGGWVFDHTGYDFQYKYGLVDRFGSADLSPTKASPHLSFPKSESFPHLLGANSSFRRQALLEIGGFDEEYEYFLDETDVCLRIVDAGWLIDQRSDAFVHHKFAPSHLRGANRVAKHRYPILKNKVYFTLKHARESHTLDAVMKAQGEFIAHQRNEMTWALNSDLISQAEMDAFVKDIDRAIIDGWRRGLEGGRPEMMLTSQKRAQWEGPFVPFKPWPNRDQCTLVLVSKDYPPDHGGGIATFSKDLAEAFARRGNIVHVVTRSYDIDRVDFEHGVWVHRRVVRDVERPTEAIAIGVPAHIWSWSALAFEEVRRIATHRRVDVVETPIWDCEGIAFLLQPLWPLVVSLQTTLHFWLDSHPEYLRDKDWMSAFGKPMLALEQRLMQGAHAIRSISAAISADIETAYGFHFDPQRTHTIPLGLAPISAIDSASTPTVDGTPRPDSSACRVLFVGRLEARKGIDVLLEAIPRVLKEEPGAMFRIVGDDTLPGPNGTPYKEAFVTSPTGRRWRDQVRFEGRVDDERLRRAYAECDIFVAPSRFESFGLVFLEAMREGKPVIGCSAGGMPEIIRDGETGLLVEPGNVDALTEALLELIRSASARQALGNAGRATYNSKFTAARMAQASVALYESAASEFRDEHA